MMKVIEVPEPEPIPLIAVTVAPTPPLDPDAMYYFGSEDVLRNDIFSDDTGLSNLQKWEQAQAILGPADDIFTEISYEEVFQGDDPYKAQAAAYIADLRAQHFQSKIRGDRCNMRLHSLFVHNATWRVRFFERANLENIAQMLRDARLM